MSTVPYCLKAWKVINAEVNRKLAGRFTHQHAAKVLALIERTQADMRAGWIEAARDALWRARRLLQTCTEGDHR